MLLFKATIWCTIDVYLCNWHSKPHIILKIPLQQLVQSVENIDQKTRKFMHGSYLSWPFTGGAMYCTRIHLAGDIISKLVQIPTDRYKSNGPIPVEFF